MRKEEIQTIVVAKNTLLKKQHSIRILEEYISFLREIEGQDELITYIEEELVKSEKNECYFGDRIYSIDDVVDFYNHHKVLIEKKLKEIFLRSRDGFVQNIYFFVSKKLSNMFDLILEILRIQRNTPFETVEAWLNESMDDIKGARRDLRAKAYKKSLSRLQRSVEILVKAYSLYLGLKTEDELKDIRHIPVEAYIDLLNQSWINRVKNIFRIKKDIKSSIKFLEKLKITNISTEDIKKEALQWDNSVPILLNYYEKFNKKIDSMFSRRGVRYLVDLCNNTLDVKAYHKAMLGFSALLLPLSISTQYYSSRYTYPDYARKLNIIYEDTNLIKNLNRICYLLEENVKFLKNSFKQNKRFPYTLLCETLEYVVMEINIYFSDEEKLDTIKKTLGLIQSNQFVKKLIEKINTNQLVKEASLYSLV